MLKLVTFFPRNACSAPTLELVARDVTISRCWSSNLASALPAVGRWCNLERKYFLSSIITIVIVTLAGILDQAPFFLHIILPPVLTLLLYREGDSALATVNASS